MNFYLIIFTKIIQTLRIGVTANGSTVNFQLVVDLILKVPDCASCLNRILLNHALHNTR